MDAFGKEKTCRCSAYWTDALSQNWDGRLLWVHPPWTLWRPVLDKIEGSYSSTMIVIMPARREDWATKLMQMVTKKMYFTRYTKLFEYCGRPAAPTKWGHWALLIQRPDPPVRDETVEEQEFGGANDLQQDAWPQGNDIEPEHEEQHGAMSKAAKRWRRRILLKMSTDQSLPASAPLCG